VLLFQEFAMIGMCQMGSVNPLSTFNLSSCFCSVLRISDEISTAGLFALEMRLPRDL
jgi:hypothetical protein